MNVDEITDGTVTLAVEGKTYQTTRLSMNDIGQVATRWRRARIEEIFKIPRLMMMDGALHMDYIARIMQLPVGVLQILRSVELQSLTVQVACEKCDKSFRADKLGVDECMSLCHELLIASGLMSRESKEGAANPTNSPENQIGLTSPEPSSDTTG